MGCSAYERAATGVHLDSLYTTNNKLLPRAGLRRASRTLCSLPPGGIEKGETVPFAATREQERSSPAAVRRLRLVPFAEDI